MPRKYVLTLAALAAIIFTAGCEMLPQMHSTSHPAASIVAPPSAASHRNLEPPSRAIRLSYLEGAVSFQAAGTKTWARAELNRPVAEGDGLWTDGGARAELHLGSAAFRMDSRTRLDFLTFNDWITQARMTQGVVDVTVRRLEPGEALEIDTPNAAITLVRPGQYRLEVQPEMDSAFVTVRTGGAEVSGTRLDYTVDAGQRVNIPGPNAVKCGIAGAVAPDNFDEFCQMRDRREDASVSAQYVAADTIGSYDLDESGAWRMDPKWGAVWTPRGLAAGWAPYRFGHWAWVEFWGWTWIDDAAWGFAPFHYGRWNSLDGAWSWIPGPREVRPIYAPALVAFLGGGGHGFHHFFWIGSAGVAWLPLGPGAVYVPPYRCSPSYLANINTTNTAIARQVFAGAITAVPREAFVRGQEVADARVEISSRQAALAQVNGAAPPVAPMELSLSPRRDRFVLEPPERSPSLTIVGRRDPAPRPVPFAQRQPILNSHPGRPLEQCEGQSLRGVEAEVARSDVRLARRGLLEQSFVPLEPQGTKEAASERNSDVRRTQAIQREMRRGQPPSNR